MTQEARLDRQRIDKWLWHARLVRARTSAAELANQGHVRVNGQKVDAASRPVKTGDVITVALERAVRILKVTGFAERRGPAQVAQALYEDLTPPPAVPSPDRAAASERGPGSGRPTKRNRRALDQLRGWEEE